MRRRPLDTDPAPGRGMPSTRRCACGNQLAYGDSEQCIDCRPQLSQAAKAVGRVRRDANDRIRALELAVSNLENTLRKLDKKVTRLKR